MSSGTSGRRNCPRRTIKSVALVATAGRSGSRMLRCPSKPARSSMGEHKIYSRTEMATVVTLSLIAIAAGFALGLIIGLALG
jgi:hypothetical protein